MLQLSKWLLINGKGDGKNTFRGEELKMVVAQLLAFPLWQGRWSWPLLIIETQISARTSFMASDNWDQVTIDS